MDLGEAARDVLLADSAVAAIAGQRVYWGKRPQGDPLPALVLTSIGGSADDLDLGGGADYQESRIQCSCLSSTHIEARNLAKAATDALMAADDVSGFLFWEGTRERPIDLGDDTDQGYVHNVVQDVILRHTPSA